jgi:fucose permease
MVSLLLSIAVATFGCAKAAIVPELQSLLADKVGVQHAPVIPVICYAYIVFLT